MEAHDQESESAACLPRPPQSPWVTTFRLVLGYRNVFHLRGSFIEAQFSCEGDTKSLMSFFRGGSGVCGGGHGAVMGEVEISSAKREH